MGQSLIRIFFVGILGVTLFPSFSSAREMQGRLGFGYNGQFANSYVSTAKVPGVSLKYALSRDMAAAGIFGISTTSPNTSVTGLKIFKNIFLETNLNFYFVLGGALISANGQSGGELLGGFGVEFFIPGLESLGFSTETGATFNNASGSYGIRTLGVSFLEAGVHFYF